jgi:hypothetical protein
MKVHCRLLLGSALAAALALVGSFPAGSGAASPPPPRVSVISDSILTAVTWGSDGGVSLGDLSNGLDLQIDAGVGRRLNGQSAEFNGAYVPTTLDVINGWSYLGSVVVIVDGYNDLPQNFAGDVELTLDTLRNRGVQHVLWVNLHDVRPEYAAKNAVLAAAAQHHPELQILDWNSYSASHPDWYQTDFIHLLPAGATAIATWIHQAIMNTLYPPPPPPPDPTLVASPPTPINGRVGVRVDRQLQATGGTAPLRWRTTGPTLRRNRLHLLASGKLVGRPSRKGTFALPVEVTDARGSVAHLTVMLTVRSRHSHAHAAR